MSTIDWVRLSLKVYPTTRKEIHDEIVKFEVDTWKGEFEGGLSKMFPSRELRVDCGTSAHHTMS